MSDKKVIDWQLSLQLANNRPELAKELLSLFMDELTPAQQTINAAYTKQDWDTLQQQVHRLHGACCYCGVPQLKEIAANLESKLKSHNKNSIDALMTALNDQIDQIVKIYPTLNKS